MANSKSLPTPITCTLQLWLPGCIQSRAQVGPSNHASLWLLLQNLGEVHFLDAGLNCRGAHVTDPQVIASLSRYVRQESPGITVHLHGTPRQWGAHTATTVLHSHMRKLLLAVMSNYVFRACGAAFLHHTQVKAGHTAIASQNPGTPSLSILTYGQFCCAY